MYKLYSGMLNERCTMMIEKNQLLPNTQNGFKPAKETAYCITALTSITEAAKKKNKPLHTVYIDFTKALDSVAHWAVEETMRHMNVPEEFVNNIKELFRNIHTHKSKHHTGSLIG